MDDDIKAILLEAYARHARERDDKPVADWKQVERAAFVDLLKAEEKHFLLDLGAGAGHDSEYFRRVGFVPVAMDLNRELLRFCRQKALPSLQSDCYDLGLQRASFEAVWSLNVLLHVPTASLDRVLSGIRDILKPGGLFYLGTWGGDGFEGIFEEDRYVPKRFFSFRTGNEIERAVGGWFERVSFKEMRPGGDRARFVSTVWRKPSHA